MNDQLTDYFLTILSKLLCAFRKKYSCQSLLVKMVDEWKNALDKKYIARISKYLNPNSRRAIHHSFIASNFSYCPLVWHFCGKTNNAKLEKIQERSLLILCNDYTSSYEDLLRNTGLSTLLLNRLKCMLLETFKSTRHLNAECLHGIFKTRVVPYDLRTTNLVQPKRQSTTYGLRSFSYLGRSYGMNSWIYKTMGRSKSRWRFLLC